MKIIESILTKNPCYTAGRKIEVKGLMIHSIGCPQPDAGVFVRNWNSPAHSSSCVHAFIDGNDGTVYQTLPWNHRGWHCGSGKNGSGNNTHIGVEMCEPSCIKYTSGSSFVCNDMEKARAVAKRTYDVAVELFAMLCEKYGLNPMADGVIISHAEGYKRGISSNHGDPDHLWRQLSVGYTMDGFRKDVKKAMDGVTTNDVIHRVQVGAYSKKENADNMLKKVKDAGFDTYMVNVDGWYKIQVGAYSVKANAEAMLKRLKDAGFEGFIASSK